MFFFLICDEVIQVAGCFQGAVLLFDLVVNEKFEVEVITCKMRGKAGKYPLQIIGIFPCAVALR